MRNGALVMIAAASLALVAASCATTAPGSNPDDMSAKMHREMAAQQEAEAAKHEAQYDPNAESVHTRNMGGVGGARGEINDFITYEQTYNPTKKHFEIAKKHEEYSRQHREAAAALEKFEEDTCGNFSKEVRVSCPLLSIVERVENIDNGARLFLTGDINPSIAAAHMRCHYAFGRKMGRQGMPACPLYLKALKIVRSGEHSVDITADDPEVVEQVRALAQSHVGKGLS